MDRYRLHRCDREVKLPPHLKQFLNAPFTVSSEMMIVPFNDLAYSDAADNCTLIEFTKALSGKLIRERKHHDGVHPELFADCKPLIQRREKPDLVLVWGENLLRMRMERDDDTSAAPLLCPCNHVANQLLVGTVNAVEGADRNHGIPVKRHLSDIVYDTHGVHAAARSFRAINSSMVHASRTSYGPINVRLNDVSTAPQPSSTPTSCTRDRM